MLICPKCKREYQEGSQSCSDCKCDLIPIPDPKKKEPVNKTNMKRTIIGIALLISSTLIYMSVSISAAICGTDLCCWSSSIGVTGTALKENVFLLIPGIISAILFIYGITILYKEYKSIN